MKMQISIIGFGILAAYSALILALVAWPLSKLLRRFAWKWAVIAPPVLVLLALPWAEEAWIAWHFANACKDAGVHVYRKVEVEGFYDSTMRSGYELIRDRGYQFMEHPADQAGKVGHVERVDGQWKETLLDRPTARYHYKHAYQPTPFRYEEPVGWRIRKSEKQIIDSLKREVIARDTGFSRSPNTVELMWSRFLGSGGYGCTGSAPPTHELRQSLYVYALIPKKPNWKLKKLKGSASHFS